MDAKQHKKIKWYQILLIIFILLVAATCLYICNYYHADDTALEAMKGSETVTINEIDCGYFFNGPGENNAIIFYPGAKVESEAYAPLLLKIAENNVDVFLLKSPFHLSIINISEADKIIDSGNYSYENWYVSGHSMGGAVAAIYSANNLDKLSGCIMLAGYPTKSLKSDGFKLLSVYGTNDYNPDALQKGSEYRPDEYTEVVIQGGNHAQFGNYGFQKGDNKADISYEDQQSQAVNAILNFINN